MSVYPRYPRYRGVEYGASSLWSRVRLLVLGDSHYFGAPEDDRESVTEELGTVAASGAPTFPYFDRVADILLGEECTRDRIGAAWRAIAFYNVAQEGADRETRTPRAAAWHNAQGPLRTTLRELSPTHILFTGLRVWNNVDLPAAERHEFTESGRRLPYSLWRLQMHDVVDAWSTYVLHPTGTRGKARVTVEHSHSVVKRLLNMQHLSKDDGLRFIP